MAAGVAWSAVRLAARAELRVRWRGLVGLGLLAGLVGGIVLASVAVAERTATAYSRLVAAVHLDDARVLVPVARPAVAEALPTLPGVVKSWVADVWTAQVEGPSVRYVRSSVVRDGPPTSSPTGRRRRPRPAPTTR